MKHLPESFIVIPAEAGIHDLICEMAY